MASPTDDGVNSSDLSDEDLTIAAHRCTVARCDTVLPRYRWVSAHNADPQEMRALDAQNLEFHCPLDNGRHKITIEDKDQNLGALTLPPELVYLIIKHLDIRSLTTFRRVSKYARHMVDGTFEYQKIMERAPQIIRGALTLEANSFTLNDAYITLLDDQCTTCHNRGGFIYLITCERVCSHCLILAPRWKPRVDVDVDWDRFGDQYPDPTLTPSAIGRPGVYGTAGGYRRVFPRPTYPQWWVRKDLSSRFWDAKHCGYVRWPLGVQRYNGTGWYASAFFVSVSVPLADRKRRDTGDDDCSDLFSQGWTRPFVSRG